MSLIGPHDKLALWASVAGAAYAGIRLEKTPVGKSLSGAVCSLLVSSLFCNVGVLPEDSSPPLQDLQAVVVKLATPLLLLGADLRRVFRETGGLLAAFVLAATGTALGAVAGVAAVGAPLAQIDGAWEMLSALTAKNIGGGLNFMAVADVLKVAPATVTTALAADNVLGLMYFPLVAWIGRGEGEENEPPAAEATTAGALQEQGSSAGGGAGSAVEDVESVCAALALGLGIASAAEGLSGRFLPGASVPISTLLSVALATALPGRLKPVLPAAGGMGRALLYLFFGSVGATSGTITQTLVSSTAGALLCFGLILYGVHLVVVLQGGRALGLGLKEVLIASNASIGNPATASALAASKGWHSLVLPALLVGTFGNAVGTFAGLYIGINALRPILELSGGAAATVAAAVAR